MTTSAIINQLTVNNIPLNIKSGYGTIRIKSTGAAIDLLGLATPVLNQDIQLSHQVAETIDFSGRERVK
ncbi:MAG: hypothetical protein K2F99_05860, partial [Muribaculaceae bacterium]|nr:hypothetical protein [Muribaculaceae bacterium]